MGAERSGSEGKWRRMLAERSGVGAEGRGAEGSGAERRGAEGSEAEWERSMRSRVEVEGIGGEVREEQES